MDRHHVQAGRGAQGVHRSRKTLGIAVGHPVDHEDRFVHVMLLLFSYEVAATAAGFP